MKASHALAFLRHGASVFTELNFFGKQLFVVLDIERSNILTLSPTTALENEQLTSNCSYT